MRKIKQFKKISAFILATAILALTLSGCNTTKKTSSVSKIINSVDSLSSSLTSSVATSSLTSSVTSSKLPTSSVTMSAAIKNIKPIVPKKSTTTSSKSTTVVSPAKSTIVAKGTVATKRNTPTSSTAIPPVSSVTPPAASGFNNYTTINYTNYAQYYALTPRQQSIYNALVNGIAALNTSPTVYTSPTNLNQTSFDAIGNDIQTVYNLINNVCTADFWIPQSFGYGAQGTQVYVNLTYSYTASQIASMQTAITNELAKVNIAANLTPFQRETAIHDWLTSTTIYDNAAESAITNPALLAQYANDFTIYGAIVQHKAVCEGYSKAMQFMLSLANVETLDYVGSSQGVPHMWNAVKLDNNWYQLDSTWDSGATNQLALKGFVVHAYFNLTDAQLKADHTFTPGISSVDTVNPNITCSNTAENYDIQMGCYITSDADVSSIIPAKIAAAKAAGQTCVEISFSPSYLSVSSDSLSSKVLPLLTGKTSFSGMGNIEQATFFML